MEQLTRSQQQYLNSKLIKMEQALTDTKGLPRRSWYKHQIYAPGFYTGYGVKTLPAVSEAIEQENWEEVQQQIVVLSETLNRFNEYIKGMNQVGDSK